MSRVRGGERIEAKEAKALGATFILLLALPSSGRGGHLLATPRRAFRLNSFWVPGHPTPRRTAPAPQSALFRTICSDGLLEADAARIIGHHVCGLFHPGVTYLGFVGGEYPEVAPRLLGKLSFYKVFDLLLGGSKLLPNM